ncbi:MAG: serine/threonine protein kinase, partial [Actinobacteria bacterium]|nr:serine/threonine protein kinase [Actinomycetota bacterium]
MVDSRGRHPVLGGYRLEEELGAGSTGTVWRARREGPVSQVVAVKRLRVGAAASEVDRLRREAEILAQLDHPHIVRVLEVVDDAGPAVVMQFAPGGSLQDLLAERGRLTPGEMVAVAAPLADALASAHRRDVLHCDVKPANVLFTSDGEPLLSDFGVARRFASAVTADQVVAGTAEYLAPELLDGGRPGVRSDVYSLGVVCYEALVGSPPYTGETPLAVVRAADRGSHVPLGTVSGVPPALAEVVQRAMARDPSDRYPGAGELA